jgi:hypothetical protein
MLVLLTFLFKMAMDAIFAAVAYHYATLGETPDHFYEEDLQSAFIKRPSHMVDAVRGWLIHGISLFRHQPPSAVSANAPSEAASYYVDDHANANIARPSPMQEDTSDRVERRVQRSDGA